MGGALGSKNPPGKKPTKKSPVKENSLTVAFSFERETKNTYRYTEDGDRGIIGTLYVQKTALGDKAPDNLSVQIRY